jgi:hypothetical protein
MALAVLQRSDQDVALVAVTEDAAELARKLGELQPFEVQVFAIFPYKAAVLPTVHNMLRAQHLCNGWYAATAEDATIVICQACCKSMPQDHSENVEHSVGDSVKQNTSDDEQMQLKWHALLEPCPREEADKATTIRRTLKELLGRWQADSILSTCKEVCLRINGNPGRYIVNTRGELLRLAGQAKEAKLSKGRNE